MTTYDGCWPPMARRQHVMLRDTTANDARPFLAQGAMAYVSLLYRIVNIKQSVFPSGLPKHLQAADSNIRGNERAEALALWDEGGVPLSTTMRS
jgi:hypothetical protein